MRDIVVAVMAIAAVGAGVGCWIFDNFGRKNQEDASKDVSKDASKDA